MDPLTRWLLTYLLHSTVLLVAAWLVRLALGERRLAVQEAVLRAALVGGFVTASLQVGLDIRPIGGRLAVPAPRAARAASPTLLPVAASSGVEALPPGIWRGRPLAASSLPPWAAGWVAAVTPRWRAVLAAAWAALVLAALARLLVAAFRLRRVLRGRRRLRPGELDPGALAAAHALGLRHPVLSEARHLSVPLATGVVHPEVCLPSRALGELGADEQVALCAHELAHLARHDPAWVLAARLVEALAPLQPMNGWARRRLSDLAECLSDDLAVSASARPLGLARSLVDVASWTLGERPFLPVASSGALSVRSRLGHRVERLMDTARVVERPRRALLPTAALAVLATALVTPVVSGSAAPPSAPLAPQAEAAPQAGPAPKAAAASRARAASKADAAAKANAPNAESGASADNTASAHNAANAGADALAKADAASKAAQERIDALSRQIEERAALRAADTKALEAQIEAVVSKVHPQQAEMEALSREIEKSARALTEAVGADLANGGKKGAETAEAARRMAQAEDRLRAATSQIRVPADEVRALAEQARALAEQVRPTAEELSEIRRLSADLARGQADQARDAMRIAMEALRQAQEALHQGGQDVKP